MDSRVDLGKLKIESGSTWGLYREVRAFAVTQASNHPGVEVFIIHADQGGDVHEVTVNRDGTLSSSHQVRQLMESWINQAKGD